MPCGKKTSLPAAAAALRMAWMAAVSSVVPSPATGLEATVLTLIAEVRGKLA
jgi:hypothetical protein